MGMKQFALEYFKSDAFFLEHPILSYQSTDTRTHIFIQYEVCFYRFFDRSQNWKEKIFVTFVWWEMETLVEFTVLK